MEEEIINLLKLCPCFENIKEEKELNGLWIPRDILVQNNDEKYELMWKELPKIKKIYSSSALTSLQNNATLTQKWPMLNLIRQILKVNGYNMNPIRKSDGYDKTGKKKYKRYFLIKKQL